MWDDDRLYGKRVLLKSGKGRQKDFPTHCRKKFEDELFLRCCMEYGHRVDIFAYLQWGEWVETGRTDLVIFRISKRVAPISKVHNPRTRRWRDKASKHAFLGNSKGDGKIYDDCICFHGELASIFKLFYTMRFGHPNVFPLWKSRIQGYDESESLDIHTFRWVLYNHWVYLGVPMADCPAVFHTRSCRVLAAHHNLVQFCINSTNRIQDLGSFIHDQASTMRHTDLEHKKYMLDQGCRYLKCGEEQKLYWEGCLAHAPTQDDEAMFSVNFVFDGPVGSELHWTSGPRVSADPRRLRTALRNNASLKALIPDYFMYGYTPKYYTEHDLMKPKFEKWLKEELVRSFGVNLFH